MPNLSELMAAVTEAGEVPCMNAPDLFFVDDDSTGVLASYNYARQLCAECPVMALCASYAVENNEIEGMWGGTTPNQRRDLRRLKSSSSARYFDELVSSPRTP